MACRWKSRQTRTCIHIEEHMRVLLFQSIRELLFNIVKHAESLDATVRLAQENGSGRITVSDPGRGIRR